MRDKFKGLIFGLVLSYALCASALAQDCADGHFENRFDAHVRSVYDGDTITADVYLPFNVTLRNLKFRLFGIDAPEVRGASRPQGLMARDWMRARVLDRDIEIITLGGKKGKYGRWLAILCDAHGDVIADMVEANHAVWREY